MAAHHSDYAPGGVLARHTGAQDHTEDEQIRQEDKSMDNKERFIKIFTSQIHRAGATELLEWLESTDFFEAPARTHYHGS